MAGTSRMSPGQLYRIAWVLYLALAIGGALWIGARRGAIPLELFVDAGSWWLDAAIGLAAAAALLGVWELLRRVAASARRLERELAELLAGVAPAEVMALALLSGFAEELFFRGAMQEAWGWVPATLLFAVLHTGPGPAFRLWTAFALVAGLTLAGLMLWRGNLLAPVVAHAVVNGVNLGRLARRAPAPEAGAGPGAIG